MSTKDTIAAISTPAGSGGIAVLRLSGPDALRIAERAWSGKKLGECESHSVHLGRILDADGSTLDEAVATIFRAPNSFTGEDVVEFSVHGSPWIQCHVLQRLISLGARAAEGGEFSKRAYLNGRIDLAQAEGVADLIAASSRAAHKLAITQTTGTYSRRLDALRQRLTDLASLLELELDFSEEDVEFADRGQLRSLADETLATMRRLIDSYASGRAFKEGVPVAIAGRPNAGKSTLLNSLVDMDKAIVSDVAGTTRDIIEETAEIEGILFRFYDTAGLRATDDVVEGIGVERARERIGASAIVLWVVDATQELDAQLQEMVSGMRNSPEAMHFLLLNKTDAIQDSATRESEVKECIAEMLKQQELENSLIQELTISAKTGSGLNKLRQSLSDMMRTRHNPDTELILTNARHLEALKAGEQALQRAREALGVQISADFIAQDIREAIHHLSALTGAITTPDLLATIFSRFCIGK